jgi:hypothetical protein
VAEILSQAWLDQLCAASGAGVEARDEAGAAGDAGAEVERAAGEGDGRGSGWDGEGRTGPAVASALVQHVVSGAPDGTVSYWTRYDGGRVVEAALGEVDGPDLTFQVGYDDAVRIDRGALELSAAYMQGRLKADGDMTRLLALLAGDHLSRTRTRT